MKFRWDGLYEPRIMGLCWADGDGGEGGGGEDEGGGKPAENQVAARPDYVPEKFWDSKAGQVRTEEAFRSYVALEQKLGQRDEETRAAIRNEIQAERLKARPEKPDGYQVALPKDYEELGIAIDPADPLVTFWREQAHEFGLSNTDFNKALARYVDASIKAQPNRDDEMAKLGDTGRVRVQALSRWAEANFGGDELAAIQQVASTAAGVQALEKLMQMATTAGGPPGGLGNPPAGDTMTPETLRAMMDDPRYWDPTKRSQAHVDRVNKGFEKLYGTKPA